MNIFEIQRPNIYIYQFKAFGMANLQYEKRIPQKIYNTAIITKNV